MSQQITVDPRIALQEASAEAEFWRQRSLNRASQNNMLKTAIVKGGPVLDAVRKGLLEQMGGEEAVAAMLAPQQADGPAEE